MNTVNYNCKVFYISDLHLQHEKILQMGRDMFSSIEEHDTTILENWKSVVGKDDVVYILGDITMKPDYKGLYEQLKPLPGHKHLIVGNHDHRWMDAGDKRVLHLFESIEQMAIINDNGRRVVLCHYPFAEWPLAYHGAYHVFGHIHNSRDLTYDIVCMQERALNACVDVTGFKPVTLDELIECNKVYKEL